MVAFNNDENTWYVAIVKFFGEFNSFIAAGSTNYRDYSEHIRKYGFDVIAERFGVSDSEVNLLTGFDREGKRLDIKPPLAVLIERLNAGESFSIGDELERICNVS